MADKMINYIALIPAYEPDSKLTEVVEELSRAGFEIVVVDDGSGSGYDELFRSVEKDAVVLTHRTNRGKGDALKTGLRYISRYKEGRVGVRTVIVTVDADGQHLAKDALRIARIAGSRPGTLVLGSREMDKNAPLRSRIGNTVTRHVFRLATGTAVYDTQTGLRAFSSDLIPAMLGISGRRYEYEINVLLEFAAGGIPVMEEKIETVYHDNNSRSHFNTIKDSVRVYKEILRFTASSFISFLTDYGLFGLLLTLTGGMTYGLAISNIGARLVSSAVNYTINRKAVFRSKAGVARSAVQYFLLAGLILAGNTIVLSTLVGTLGLAGMAAKIITELIFFAISWTVQKYVIFYQEDPDGAADTAAKGGLRSMRFRAVRTRRLRECRKEAAGDE